MGILSQTTYPDELSSFAETLSTETRVPYHFLRTVRYQSEEFKSDEVLRGVERVRYSLLARTAQSDEKRTPSLCRGSLHRNADAVLLFLLLFLLLLLFPSSLWSSGGSLHRCLPRIRRPLPSKLWSSQVEKLTPRRFGRHWVTCRT